MKNRIKELREQRGLTQEQLGELVGASRQAINAIETEKFEPSIWLAYPAPALQADDPSDAAEAEAGRAALRR